MPETTAPTVHECEVFLLIDENGNYSVHTDQSELLETYNSEIGEDLGSVASRIVAITVRVPAPLPVTVIVEVPAESSVANVSVK